MKKKSDVSTYIDKNNFLNGLWNTILTDVLYEQIQELFPNLFSNEDRLTDEEIEYICNYIKSRSNDSVLCKIIDEKVNTRYMQVIKKYGESIEQHNKSIKYKEKSKYVIPKQNRNLIDYTQYNLQKIKTRNKNFVKKSVTRNRFS